MKTSADNFIAGISRHKLARVYLVTGSEPLICQQVEDAIRQKARAAGFDERSRYVCERGFDWGQLMAESANLSLFSSRKMLELQLLSSKIGDNGSRALTDMINNLSDDVVFVISCDKLEQNQWRTKWIKAIESAGVVIQVWPVDRVHLPKWIASRARQKGMTLGKQGIEIIAERVEGNLLAAAQELEKLWLAHGETSIDDDTVRNAVVDSSRFNVYTFVDYCLSGDIAKVTRVLETLRSEGTEPVLIVWALAREIRSLGKMAQRIKAGEYPDTVFNENRVWERRRPLIGAALRRHPISAWNSMLMQCADIDLTVKGLRPDNAWNQLTRLGSQLAGVNLFDKV